MLPTPVISALVALATELDEGADKRKHRAGEQPRRAVQHLQDAPADKKGKSQENQNGQRKFHIP